MVAVIVILAVVVIVVLLFGARYRSIGRPNCITYQIIPPAIGEPPDAEYLFALIAELLKQTKVRPWRPKPRLGFEVVVSGEAGTLFLVTAPIALAGAFKRHLIAFSPRLRIVKIRAGKGYQFPEDSFYQVQSWRPAGWFYQPVSVGLIDTVLVALSALKPNEVGGWQVLIEYGQRGKAVKIPRLIAAAAWQLARAAAVIWFDATSDPVTARQRAYNRAVQIKRRPPKRRLPFRVCARSLVAAGSVKRRRALNLGLNAAIRTHGLKPISFSKTQDPGSFKRCSFGRGFVVGADGAAQLYHLPVPGGKWEETARLGYSASLGGATGGKLDVIVGMGESGARKVPVGLSRRERSTHTLIVGGTGMGKSTLLGQCFAQDMRSGKGAALLDPHGDLARSMLRYVPRKRLPDVIYINPADLRYPVAINLLERPQGISGDELALAKDFITEAVVSIMRKLFSDDDSGGHRIEYILRNTIHTAFYVPGANLFTLHKLLTNDLFRSGVLSSIDDDSLKDFWYGEFNKGGSYQRVKMSAGVTAKLGRFQRSAAASRMLEPAHSSIDFDKVLDGNKLLICNLDKGDLGEDTASLLGMVILAKLQLASWRRSIEVSVKSKSFGLYVDEFALFNAPIFTQLISESRKFGINLMLAEQTTAFQTQDQNNILLANVGNVISFRTAADIDNKRLLPLFEPYLKRTDLVNLEPFHFYLKSAGEAAKRPVSAETVVLKGQGSRAASDNAIRSSRKLYGYPYMKRSGVEPRRVPLRS